MFLAQYAVDIADAMLFLVLIALILFSIVPLNVLVEFPLHSLTSIHLPWWMTVGAIALFVSWLFGE